MLNYKDYFSKLRSGELPQALLFDGEEAVSYTHLTLPTTVTV